MSEKHKLPAQYFCREEVKSVKLTWDGEVLVMAGSEIVIAQVFNSIQTFDTALFRSKAFTSRESFWHHASDYWDGPVDFFPSAERLTMTDGVKWKIHEGYKHVVRRCGIDLRRQWNIKKSSPIFQEKVARLTRWRPLLTQTDLAIIKCVD